MRDLTAKAIQFPQIFR